MNRPRARGPAGQAAPPGIDTTAFPYLGNRQPQNRYRLVLDAVSVPPAYLQQVVAAQEQPWRYWHKAGLVVRASKHAVTITIPVGAGN